MARPFRQILEIKNAEPKGFVAVLECGHEKFDYAKARFGNSVRCNDCGHRWSRIAAACLGCGRTDRSYAINGLCYVCEGHRWPPVRYGTNLTGNIRIYPIHDKLFDEWNERSAYLYGVLFSDGSIQHGRNRAQISIILSYRDLTWLQWLKQAFGFSGKTCFRKIPTGMSVGITMTSKHAVERLIALGLKNSPPITMPDNLIPHFVRGVIDGDGSVFFDTNAGKFHSNITGCRILLDWISDKMHRIVGTRLVKTHRKNNAKDSWSIRWASRDTALLADALYLEATLFLKRKHKLFQKAKGAQ